MTRLSHDDRQDLIWYYSSAPGELGLRSSQSMCQEILSAGVLPGKHERKYGDGIQDKQLASAAKAYRIASTLKRLSREHERALRLQYTRSDVGWANEHETGSHVCIDGHTVALLLGTQAARFAYSKSLRYVGTKHREQIAWLVCMRRNAEENKITAKIIIDTITKEATEWLEQAEICYAVARKDFRQ